MGAEPNSKPARDLGTKLGWIGGASLLVAVAVLIALRLHAFDLPLETDECNYAYIGGRLLAGDRLYVDVWDHQPFGVFTLFAGVIGLFGDAPEVFRWMATLFSLVSLVLIYGIVHLSAGRAAAITAAALFALASSDPGTAGEGCNREIYMNTFILAAWYLAMRRDTQPGWAIFAAGVALAIGSSLKTIVAVHWVLLAVWVGVTAWRSPDGEHRLRPVLTRLALFAAGPTILWLAAAGYYTLTERLGEFVDAVFLFNLSYADRPEGFFVRFGRFFAPPRHPFIFDSAMPVWIGSIGAAVWLIIDFVRKRHDTAAPILLLLLGSYLATCLPAQFWPHYYYLLMPPAVIAVSAALGSLTSRLPLGKSTGSSVLRYAPIVVWAALPIWLAATEYRSYLSQPPFGITVKRYNSRDFWGRAQGQNARRVTDPGDEIFVFGSDTGIYYYAERRCPSRYTMITGLGSGMTGAERRRATLMSELRERPPRLIIVLFDEQPFDDWLRFLERYYGEAVGVDRHDRTGNPIMAVFARKDRPIETIDWDWDRSEVGGWIPGGNP
jgi:hypothetical protein